MAPACVGATSAALGDVCCTVAPPVTVTLIAHARVCVSALLSLSLAMMAPAWRDISCSRAGAAQLPPLAVTPIAHMLVCLSVLPSVGLTLMAPAWRVISCSRALAAQLRPA